MAVVLGSRQQIPDLLDKGLPALRIGPAEQLFGLLPRQPQTMQGGADRLAAAGPAELLTAPANQRGRRGAASAPAAGGAAAEHWVARTVSPRPASISGQRGGRCADRSAPWGCCRDAATPSPSEGDGASARQRAWRSSPE